jgi:signal transduction histidine kinase
VTTRTLLLLLLLTGAGRVQALTLQDTLEAKLSRVTADTPRAFLLLGLVNEYASADLVKCRRYADMGLALTTRMGWKKGMGVFLKTIGDVYDDLGKYDSARIQFNLALVQLRAVKDTFNQASVLNDMGNGYQQQGMDVEAASYFFQSVALSETKHLEGLVATAYDNIALIYSDQHDMPKALDYANKALAAGTKNGDKREMAGDNHTIADIYLKTNDTVKAAAYYKKCIVLYQEIGDELGLAQAYANYALIYPPDNINHLKGCLKAQEIFDRISPLHSISITNTGNIGTAYLDIVRSDPFHRVKRGGLVPIDDKIVLLRAETYLKKAIDMASKAGITGSYYTGVLAEAEALRGDYKDAYEDFRNYQDAQDSAYSQDSKNKLASLEEQHEVALRDKQIVIGKLNLLAEKRRRLALSLGLGLLGVIGVLLYFQSRARQKTNKTLRKLNAELDEAGKVKARFFAILSHDLRSPITNFINFLHLQREKPDLLDAKKTAAHQQKIADYAEGLLNTMEAMLLWSKGQMENFTPESKEVSVRDLFKHIQVFFAEGGEDLGTLRFADPGELTLETDENYVKTVMHNLSANALRAVQHTPGGMVEWKAYTGSGDLILEISDNGPGMTRQQAVALEEGQPVGNAKRGFGLHIVRDLARAIHCAISVHSSPEEGTRFTLRFDGAGRSDQKDAH